MTWYYKGKQVSHYFPIMRFSLSDVLNIIPRTLESIIFLSSIIGSCVYLFLGFIAIKVLLLGI